MWSAGKNICTRAAHHCRERPIGNAFTLIWSAAVAAAHIPQLVRATYITHIIHKRRAKRPPTHAARLSAPYKRSVCVRVSCKRKQTIYVQILLTNRDAHSSPFSTRAHMPLYRREMADLPILELVRNRTFIRYKGSCSGKKKRHKRAHTYTVDSLVEFQETIYIEDELLLLIPLLRSISCRSINSIYPPRAQSSAAAARNLYFNLAATKCCQELFITEREREETHSVDAKLLYSNRRGCAVLCPRVWANGYGNQASRRTPRLTRCTLLEMAFLLNPRVRPLPGFHFSRDVPSPPYICAPGNCGQFSDAPEVTEPSQGY
uniref:Uncharacterized protein n=1 Tax=Trichogramma kaykai TaxID=54128 RepID=A0ABD2VY54_9HYME